MSEPAHSSDPVAVGFRVKDVERDLSPERYGAIVERLNGACRRMLLLEARLRLDPGNAELRTSCTAADAEMVLISHSFVAALLEQLREGLPKARAAGRHDLVADIEEDIAYLEQRQHLH